MKEQTSTDHLGLCWHKDKWRHFERYSPVKRGKRKGCYWVQFPEGQRLVYREHIKRFPTDQGQIRLF